MDESSDIQDWDRFLKRIFASLEQATRVVDYRKGLLPDESDIDLHGGTSDGMREFFTKPCQNCAAMEAGTCRCCKRQLVKHVIAS